MTFTVNVYQRRVDTELEWTTVGLGPHEQVARGHSALKLQRQLADRLRALIAAMQPIELERFDLRRGIKLEVVSLDLTLKGPPRVRVSGKFPLVLEPRWISNDKSVVIAYHPRRQSEWFPLRSDRPIESQATLHFQTRWSGMERDEAIALEASPGDTLRVFSFEARAKSLLENRLDQGPFADLQTGDVKQPSGGVLARIGINLTMHAIDGSLPAGLPRRPYREQLQSLLAGDHKRSVVVIGPPGSGKSTLIGRWVHDRLEADDYRIHKNLDRVLDVWQISGKRIIAGMAYLGDWEQRCVDLLSEASRKPSVLYVDDLHAFGKIGRTRHSDRNLADFFRGPLVRGEVVIIGECTAEQMQRLEDDAPSFASLFTRLIVSPASREETIPMMLHEARSLEANQPIRFEANAYRAILELSSALFPAASFPGKALDLMREIAPARGVSEGIAPIGASTIASFIARKTGLPLSMLGSGASAAEGDDLRSEPIDPQSVERFFSSEIAGQPQAIAAAVELILKIDCGLTDPSRPFGVYLFTGPTGTGKTELATAIARYLFGDPRRLLRFDMAELSTPDAVARLIGDAWDPEGLLTKRVQEQPFSVVLLDEIEKAHPAVLNLLLQVLDEGRLTDAAGTSADFRRTVIVMTSNLGARDRSMIGFGDDGARVVHDVAQAVRQFFPPELFNRIDRVVPFFPLDRGAARRIAEKEIARLVSRRGLIERSIFVRCDEAVIERVLREAFDVRDGARPVKRWLERTIGDVLTAEIVKTGPSAIRSLSLFDTDQGPRPSLETARESEPLDATFALLPLLEAPLEAITAGLRRAMTLALEAARSTRHDSTHWFEVFRSRRQELEARVEELLEGPAKKDRRQDLLEALSDAIFLTRIAGQLHDAEAHTVNIELVRAGASRRSPSAVRLLVALTELYAARGEVEGFEARYFGGEVEARFQPNWAENREPERVMLSLSGLGLRDWMALEEGSHISRSIAGGTELVIVRRAAADPIVLLPEVRRLSIDARPLLGGFEVEIEDHRISFTDRLRAETIALALKPLELVQRSRT